MDFKEAVKPIYQPESVRRVGAATISVDLTLLVEETADSNTVHSNSAKQASVFNADSWRTELIWLMVQTIMKDFNQGAVEMKEALEEVINHLDKLKE